MKETNRKLEIRYENSVRPIAFRLFGCMLIGLLLLSLINSTVLAQTQTQFLPFVVSGTDFRSGGDDLPTSCEFVANTTALATLFKTDPGQQRPIMNCDPILMLVAQAKAEDMANNNYFGHVSPDGEGPNYLATEAGYQFPSNYATSKSANQIESIYAGSGNPSSVWTAWMGSLTHEEHLLGLNGFFAAQNEYGIGYAYNPNSPYKHYWVVLTGKPAAVSQ